VSKLLEPIVARQLIEYLQSSDLLPCLQSGFRLNISTETRTPCPVWSFGGSSQWGHHSLLLLDLSAAFDTHDHNILYRRLKLIFGLRGPVLAWFQSYLRGRSQYVYRGMHRLSSVQLVCGVPEGSWPICTLLARTKCTMRAECMTRSKADCCQFSTPRAFCTIIRANWLKLLKRRRMSQLRIYTCTPVYT